MFRKTLVMISMIFLSSNLFSNEILDKFIYAVKSKDIIEYRTTINMNDESKGLTEFKGKCIIKNVPSDTIIGAYYNFSSDESTTIYSGDEYLNYYPEIYGSKIVKLLLKSNKPQEFSEQKFEMNGQTLIAPSRVKSSFYYLCSPIELIKDLVELDSTYKMILLSDTIIDGIETRRIRYTIQDEIRDGEKELYYYLVAFDKKTDLPVYFLKYYTTQQTEVYYTEYQFNPKNIDYLFTRKAFPEDFIFDENPVHIKSKSLEIGTTAPDWTLKTIYDKEISLSEFKGKPVLFIISEIGCAPCMVAIPDLNDIAEKYKNIKVVSIYPRDNIVSLIKHAEKKKITYDILDNSDNVAKSYYCNSYPTFFIIDSNGILRYIHAGYGNGMKEILEDELNQVLNQ